MDSAYYEDLAGRLYGLLIRLDGRLGRRAGELLHHFIEVGVYSLTQEESPARSPKTRSPSPTRNGATCWRWLIGSQFRGEALAAAFYPTRSPCRLCGQGDGVLGRVRAT